MKLSLDSITREASVWEQAGIRLPKYDVKAVAEKTKKEPTWIHFGAGNIFRGYIAGLLNDLLDKGEADTGLIAAETFDYDIADMIYKPFDSLTLLATLLPTGTTKNNVIASIADCIKADYSKEEEIGRLKAMFRSEKLQMVSYTVTEKGYGLTNINGELLPVVQQDIQSGPQSVKHAMSITAALLYERYQAGAYPIAVVSMDNCSHNGEKLKNAVLTVARAWVANGKAEAGFTAYLEDETRVSFPWSMIDKITPRPAEAVKNQLSALGVEDMEPVITSRNTYIAPFVNAEEPQYLVIEDRFPNGRPALEKAGVYFTDRDTVNRVERMKVTTCLNPLHTALAVYGCVLGYNLIADEMNDPQLKGLVEKIGYEEGMKVVTDPGILSPMDFIHEVIDKRLPNPFMPDTPQRIATDTSQKIPVRFGETIKSYVASDELDASELTYIPLALAGWLRYLLAVDDELQPMTLSSDPMLEQLQQQLAGIVVGDLSTYKGQLKEIMSNPNIFGISLYEAGLAEKVEDLFIQEIAGAGAVRRTLEKYL
ncbi:MAG: mannitol dehydrogenase family protein [Lachnospiraceae bacterium]|nr:mannitol dehydrogenase family protein [Lachnospiraceae bacterium]